MWQALFLVQRFTNIHLQPRFQHQPLLPEHFSTAFRGHMFDIRTRGSNFIHLSSFPRHPSAAKCPLSSLCIQLFGSFRHMSFIEYLGHCLHQHRKGGHFLLKCKGRHFHLYPASGSQKLLIFSKCLFKNTVSTD